MILIYTTTPNEKEAKEIANDLLKKKLIACANLFPIQSVYPWKEEIAEDKECALILKTTEELFEKTKKEIKKLHSYEIPCIIKLNAEPNQEYHQWLIEQLKP